MDIGQALDLGRQAIWLTLLLAAPVLGAGLLVALVVGILQSATQMQDPTLSFIPKIAAMLLATMLAGPWIVARLVEFSRLMFGSLR